MILGAKKTLKVIDVRKVIPAAGYPVFYRCTENRAYIMVAHFTSYNK